MRLGEALSDEYRARLGVGVLPLPCWTAAHLVTHLCERPTLVGRVTMAEQLASVRTLCGQAVDELIGGLWKPPTKQQLAEETECVDCLLVWADVSA